MTTKTEKSLSGVTDLSQKVKQFNELLTSIENLEEKKKALWIEIYENAITDRVNGYVLFTELHKIVKADATQHAIQGPQLAKYLERMGKCTDQLIRLAELVAEAEKANEHIDSNEIYGAQQRPR